MRGKVGRGKVGSVYIAAGNTVVLIPGIYKIQVTMTLLFMGHMFTKLFQTFGRASECK